MMNLTTERIHTTRIDGGFTWYPKTDTIRLDYHLAAALGFSTNGASIAATKFRELIHPGDLPGVERKAEAAVASRSPMRLAFAVKDRFGDYRDVKIEGFWLEDEDGDLYATCNRVLELDDAEDTAADRIAEHALQIMKISAGRQGLPVKLMAEHILVHLMRQDAEEKVPCR